MVPAVSSCEVFGKSLKHSRALVSQGRRGLYAAVGGRAASPVLAHDRHSANASYDGRKGGGYHFHAAGFPPAPSRGAYDYCAMEKRTAARKKQELNLTSPSFPCPTAFPKYNGFIFKSFDLKQVIPYTSKVWLIWFSGCMLTLLFF